MSEKMHTICPTCTEAVKLTCDTCHGVSYCSEECQETDWPAHKLLCNTYKDFQERPNENMRRTIYFPPDGSKPEFVWLPTADHEYDENGELWYEDLEKEDRMKVNMISNFYENKITNVSLETDDVICLWYDDRFLANYTSINKAIKSAVGSMMAYPWSGPLLAMRGKPTGGGSFARVRDMDMTAYSYVVAFLTDYVNFNKTYQMTKGPKIKGVKVLCDGEMEEKSAPRFQAVNLPRLHPMIHSVKDTPDISKVSLELLRPSCADTDKPL